MDQGVSSQRAAHEVSDRGTDRKTGLAQRVETFAQGTLTAGVNRHSSNSELTGGRLSQLLGEGKEVSRFVRFERYEVFLLAESESMCEMDLNIRKFLTNHEILLHQRIALRLLHREPVFALSTRIEEKVLFFAGVYVKAVFDTVGNKDSFLRDGKIIVGGLKKVAEICPVKLCRHILDQIERRSDAPKHHVGLGVESYQRIAKKQEIVMELSIYFFEIFFEGLLRWRAEFSPVGIDPEKHVANKLPVDLLKLLRVFSLRHESKAALFVALFRRIWALHFFRIEARMSTRIFCQLLNWKSKLSIRFIEPIRKNIKLFTNRLFSVKIADMSRLLASLTLIFAAACAALAQQRPLLTDDVDIVPEGTINIGAGVEFLQNAKFPLSGLKGDLTRVGDIRIRTGFAPNIELQIEGTLQNFLAINSQMVPSPIPLSVTGNSTNDVDDFIVATKIKLLNEQRNLPAVGLKIGFQMPNTDQAKGIGTNQINVFTKFLIGKKFGKRSGKSPLANVYGNLGLAIMTAPIERFTQNDVVLYGLAGIFRLTDHINVVGEVNGRANTRNGPAPLGTESLSQFRIGSQIRASGLRFDTAAVVGLTHNSPRTGIVFGVTYQTPAIFTPAK